MSPPFLILRTLPIAIALAAAPAASQAALLGFDVKAGLDKGTIEFLKAYPANVRTEFVAAVDQSLDRFDQSAADFFASTNELLNKTQETTRCMTQQLGQVPADWLRNAAELDRNVSEELNEDLEDLRSDAGWRTTPSKFRRLYADFDAKASKADCLTAAGDLLKPEILRYRKQARESYILWARLEGQCSDSQSCYDLVHTGLQENLEAALGQDKAKIDADARFALVAEPPRKTGWFMSYPWRPYQVALVDMLRINDELALVAHARQEQGQAALAIFKQDLRIAQQDIATAQALSKGNWDQKAAACNAGYKISKRMDGISSKLGAVEPFEVLTDLQLSEYRKAVVSATAQAHALRDVKNSGLVNSKGACSVKAYRQPSPDQERPPGSGSGAF